MASSGFAWSNWLGDCTLFLFMNEDQSVKDTLKAVNQGRGKKIAYLVLAAVAVALLIGAFLSKTRGTDVEESSAAMVESTHEGQEAAASSPDAMPQASP